MPKFPEKAVLALCIGPDCGQDISRGLVKLSDMHRVGSVLKGELGWIGCCWALTWASQALFPAFLSGLTHAFMGLCLYTNQDASHLGGGYKS